MSDIPAQVLICLSQHYSVLTGDAGSLFFLSPVLCVMLNHEVNYISPEAPVGSQLHGT